MDTSGVNVELEVQRFEIDLFQNNYNDSVLYQQYDYFFQVFVERMIAVGQVGSPSLDSGLTSFITDEYVSKVYEEVAQNFVTLDVETFELQNAFNYYAYYFPDRKIPEVVTFISGFNYGVVALDSSLGIGLDMFLGKDNNYYTLLQIPNYQRIKMDRDDIPIQAYTAWIKAEFEGEKPKSMLDMLMQSGKILYLLDASFVGYPDSLKIGYTQPQMEWAIQNEFNVWSHLVDNKLLYSKIFAEYFKFFNDGPFTSSISRESPPRLGEYIGWQVVRSFMDNNDVTLDSLMNIKDSQYLLSKSKYKPNR